MQDSSESPEGGTERDLINGVNRRYMEVMKKRRKS